METDLVSGTLLQLAPGVNRLIAPNPGMMTGPGTNTYILGEKEVAVIDPGPAIDGHVDLICELAPGPIKWILVTHTHPDHSPAVVALAERTGAERLGRPAPDGQHQDKTFEADRVLANGEVFRTAEFRLEVIHTPGHASNHLCYFNEEIGWLFTGDHIISGSTVVIDPPDGNMSDYLASLERLMDKVLAVIAPGHGDPIDSPYEAIDWIIKHRLEREAKVIAALDENPNSTLTKLVPHAYDDVHERLYGWAERSLLAHLLKLENDDKASQNDDLWSLASTVGI
jgi:glyoxylase-like metal-dependent hydrolase (beta-lactamase superfamily II)